MRQHDGVGLRVRQVERRHRGWPGKACDAAPCRAAPRHVPASQAPHSAPERASRSSGLVMMVGNDAASTRMASSAISEMIGCGRGRKALQPRAQSRFMPESRSLPAAATWSDPHHRPRSRAGFWDSTAWSSGHRGFPQDRRHLQNRHDSSAQPLAADRCATRSPCRARWWIHPPPQPTTIGIERLHLRHGLPR